MAPSPFRFLAKPPQTPQPDEDLLQSRRRHVPPVKRQSEGSGAGTGLFKTIVRKSEDTEARRPEATPARQRDDDTAGEDATGRRMSGDVSRHDGMRHNGTRDHDKQREELRTPRPAATHHDSSILHQGHSNTATTPQDQHTAKRPRLSAGAQLSQPAFNTPPPFALRPSTTAHFPPAFISRTPGTPSIVPPPPNKPRFLPSHASSTAASAPLPLAFSPHARRTTQRFVPGGWAMQVRAWIVDVVAETGEKEDEMEMITVAGDEVKRAEKRGNGEACAVLADEKNGRLVVFVGEGAAGAAAGEKVFDGRVEGKEGGGEAFAAGRMVELGAPRWKVRLAAGGDGMGKGRTVEVCAGWRVV